MAPGPEISVIVGAYSRRTYLLGAIRSIEAQTLPPERYELVVTKNFRDPAIDLALERAGATVVFDDEPRLGRWLRRAVDRSTAPIVTFLNDDDEYEPERLREIVELWGRRPELGFYRNRVRVIDGDGRPVPPERWRRHELDAEFDRSGPVYLPPGHRKGLLELASVRANPTFNSSTMAIRRELLAGDVGEAYERTSADDQFLFVAGALAPYGLYLDDRRLTRFRFTGASLTHTVRWLGEAADSYGELADLARRLGREEFAPWLGSLAVHYGRMYRGSRLVERIRGRAPRREIAGRAAEYLRYLGEHPEERRLDLDTWAAVAYGLAYAGAPSLVRQIANERPTARRDGLRPRPPADVPEPARARP